MERMENETKEIKEKERMENERINEQIKRDKGALL